MTIMSRRVAWMPVRRERTAAIGEDKGTITLLLTTWSYSDIATKYRRKIVQKTYILVCVYV